MAETAAIIRGESESVFLEQSPLYYSPNEIGVKSDVRAIAKLLHAHGALFFCDYAAGAPYMPICISETGEGAGDHIDALFLSPHKFVGGPGASGLLICDKALFEGIEPTADLAPSNDSRTVLPQASER